MVDILIHLAKFWFHTRVAAEGILYNGRREIKRKTEKKKERPG